MHGRRSHPALVVTLLVAVLAASVAGGWFIAGRAAGERVVAADTRPDPAEPTYDAGDPADGPPVDDIAATGAVDAAPPLPGDVIAEAPTPPQSAPASPTPDPVPTPDTAPAPDPTPDPTPDPSPAPPPPVDPSPAPDAPAPSGPPEPTLTPYDPPPAIGIAAGALPPEGRAWSLISAARRSAPAGSQERADLDWLVGFARTAAAPGRPEGRRATARRALRVNAWWFARRPSPDSRVIARDPDGVILTYKRGHGFMVNPVATIGRWRGLNELWSPAQLADSVIPMLAERSHAGREWAALEYFDVPGDRSAVRPGVSGMGQARAASLFAKAWSQTGDPRYLRATERVLRAFEVPVNDGGVRASVSDPSGGPAGTWYPERAYPGAPPWTGAALNGFMVTIIELRRAADALGRTAAQAATAPATPAGTPDAGIPDAAAQATTTPTATAPGAVPAPGGAGDTPTTAAPGGTTGADAAAAAALARAVADRAQRSLVRFLPLHDTGSWSYYGLLTPGKPWRTYLADLNYHCYHVSLLRTLHALYPDDGLSATADAWQGYVDRRAATCPAR